MLKQIKKPGSDNTPGVLGGQQFKHKPQNDTSDSVLAALELAGMEVSASAAIEARRLELAEVVNERQYLRLPSYCGCGGSETFEFIYDTAFNQLGNKGVTDMIGTYERASQNRDFDRGVRNKSISFAEYARARQEMGGLK